MVRHLLFVRLTLLALSCLLAMPALASVVGLQHARDVVWASPRGFDLTLDIAMPEGDTRSRPVLVIFHGGGWLLNSKAIMSDLADAIAARADMVTVNVDYRLLSDLDNTTTVNEIVEDAMGAVLWVKQHIHRYGGDPNRVAITGDSAGGHLAAMVAVAGRALGSDGFRQTPLRFTPTYLPDGKTAEQVAADDGLRVQAVLLSYAAFNLLDIARGGMESASNPFWGWANATPRGLFGSEINFDQHPEHYLAVSPDQYLPGPDEYRLAPQFLHVGGNDPVTTPDMTRGYVERVRALGQRVRLKVYEGRGHGYLDSGCNDYNNGCFAELSEPAVSDMVAFLGEVFPSTPPYQDTSLDFVERARDLVGRMSLAEKVPQLINDAPAIPRLGVREYNWWNEGLHGVAALGEATVFPQAIGMAAAWDEPLMLRVAEVISTEFRAKHYARQHRFGGSDWFAGLTVWSPNINIFRDPRWGRGQETYGEDPHLSARLGVAFVKGLQGEDPRYLRTVATPKHYAVHSGPEASRHRDDIHPSAKDLEETYLPAFRATVMEAGAQSVMCAYNAVDGVPACASSHLLRDILREQWGFDGFVVSDCEAVLDIYHGEHHAYTATPAQAIKAAFEGGMDLICGDARETNHIHQALEQGLITEAQIDTSLIRLFTARMRLGQFDPRPMVFPSITPSDNDTDENRQLALTMAKKSLVLLKNHEGFLPFDDSIRNIAVIGPNADSWDALVGNYNGTPSQPVTVLKGMRSRFGDARIRYALGSGLLAPEQSPVPDAVLCTDADCATPGLTAEYFRDRTLSGDPIMMQVEANAQVRWHNEVASGSIRWRGHLRAPESGSYSLRYLADGGYRIWVDDVLVIDAWNVDWRPVIASGSVELEAGRLYPIRIEAFQRGEHGDEQLVWSLPSDPGATSALAAAEASDVVVFVGGLTAQLEGEEMPVPLPGFSGGDRTDLALPRVQRELLARLYATGKPVVLVLMNGSPLAVNDADLSAAAIVEAWYPGGQGGDAIAALLAGDFSPAGRLPVTFYRSLDQLPPFGDYAMANRTYRYHRDEVLYPFGHGLSYSTFRYGEVRVSPGRWNGTGAVTVTVDVRNTGTMAADEVVQLYLSHVGVDDAPIRALAGFQRIELARGETRTVVFELDDRALSTVNQDGQRTVEAGEVVIWVGGGQPGQRAGLEPAAGNFANLRITRGKTL